MKPPMRPLRRYWLATLSFFAVSVPLAFVMGYVYLAALWAAERVGLLKPTGSGSMFVGGRFFPLPPLWMSVIMAIGSIVVLVVPALCAALFVYHRLTFRGARDGETRCRRCDYILKGLTEPRCPECGERI